MHAMKGKVIMKHNKNHENSAPIILRLPYLLSLHLCLSDINVLVFNFKPQGGSWSTIKRSWETHAHARDLFQIQTDFHLSHPQGPDRVKRTVQAFLVKVL